MKTRNTFANAYSFKKSLVALVGLTLLVGTFAALMPLVGRGQGDNPLRRDPRRSFYLTQTEHDGSQALTACAAGYHMASLWEIFDTSNLRYNTELGFTLADSGLGPPSGSAARGWVRTGNSASSFDLNPGRDNCDAYTRADENFVGTLAHLPNFWHSTSVTVITPWEAFAGPCRLTRRVWCVQD